MNRQTQPFAFELYRRFRNGQSPEQLAAELGIPVERIRMRIKAAAAYWRQHARGSAPRGFSAGLVTGVGRFPVAA